MVLKKSCFSLSSYLYQILKIKVFAVCAVILQIFEHKYADYTIDM